MRKESTKYIKSIFLAVLTAMLLVSCGGGGGGGGMVSFSNNSELHNGGDAGGWGGSGGGINNGSNSNGEVELIITGSTPLNVTGYIYNGTTYPDAASLLNVLSTSTLPDSFTVDFTVANDDGTTETREARVSANGTAGNGQDIFIEHQYMATVALPDIDGVPGAPITIPFYKRDGISLADIANAIGNETVGSGADEVLFELRKLKIGTTEYDKNGSLAVNESGDVTLDGNSIKGVYDKWGISSSKTIQFSSSLENGDAIAINTNEQITKIELPGGGKVIKLDLQNMGIANTTFDVNFIYPLSFVSELVLPNGIETIASSTFGSAARLTSVTLPASVTTIEERAFQSCSTLESVNLPNGLTTLELMAFYGCSNLKSITIPSSLETIGEDAFNGCSALESLTIQNGVKNIDVAAFCDCSSLENIIIPDSVETIGNGAFIRCTGLQNITLPTNSNFSELSTNLFYGCSNLETVNIPNSVATIRRGAFKECAKLRRVNNTITYANRIDLPSSITMIEGGAFENCWTDSSLASNGVSLWFYSNPTLGADAFKDCSYITYIRSMDSEFNPNPDAFSGLTNLETLDLFSCTNITVNASMFAYSTKNVHINLAQDNIAITFVDDVIFTRTQPLFVTGNANHFNDISLSGIDITTCTWGGKDIYFLLNAGSNAGYYQFNASGGGGNGCRYIIDQMASWPDAVIAATP